MIADDVAVQDSLYTAGRRGVGLTVLAEKILGAAAEDKRDLDALLELAQRINDGGRSFGVALTSCTVPAAGKPTFDLDENKIEMGVGIHGEPGRETATLGTAAEVAAQIVEPILLTVTSLQPRSLPCLTAWAAPLSSSSTSCGEKSPKFWREKASRLPAPWSAITLRA
ncbi:phosphoenolpyruvate-dihydroxyacetone phosphotransferase [Cutibacterium acnes JCM 18916]|nr:phosphoenolpyruvate-dihydroxyacetone phosphotransferase [Cutibacterium acnes JCM 18916]